MVYVFENNNNNASVVFSGDTITEEQKRTSIQINELPNNMKKDNQTSFLKCNKKTSEVWYEYVDIEINQEFYL